MSHDLLVYGRRWTDDLPHQLLRVTGAMGVEVTLPPALASAHALQHHAGFLRAAVRIASWAPLTLAKRLAKQGQLEGGFDFYVEQLAPTSGDHGLADVPADLAPRIRKATFCGIITLSHEDSPAAAISAYFFATALCRITEGVVFDPEAGVHLDAEHAQRGADDFLEHTFVLANCMRSNEPFRGARQ